MREVAHCPDSQQAQTLADYLYTLEVKTRLLEDEKGWTVWVCDEDRLEFARQEANTFLANPHEGRYQSARKKAAALRREEYVADEEYNRIQAKAREAAEEVPSRAPQPITYLLFLGILFVFTGMEDSADNQGKELPASLVLTENKPRYSPFSLDSLSEIREGQLWRLVTPSLLHLDFMHLAFNLMALLTLGGQIESARGSRRFLLLVLVLAIFSNLAQFYFGHPEWRDGVLFFVESARFGGLSGVIFGFFGYLWMKSSFEPEFGLHLEMPQKVILMGWFFLCLFGFIGHVANAAHASGLVLGLIIGYTPTLVRQLFD